MVAIAWGRWTLGVALVLALASAAVACEIKVRDAAFGSPRDMHRLCVMARGDDSSAQSIADELEGWLKKSGAGLNIELVFIAADDPKVRWSEYGIPSAPHRLPVVVLYGRNNGVRQSFFIEHWEPAPDDDDLAALVNSPVRQQLQEQLGGHLAVLLYAPGRNSDSGKSRDTLDQAVKHWGGDGAMGVSVVQLDRTDERERTLLSFIDLDPNGGDDWVGVVFGRGKLMAPPLQGAEITQPHVTELIKQLEEACSCSKPLTSMGVDIPLIWDERLDATVVRISEVDATVEPAELPGMAVAGSSSKATSASVAERVSEKSAASIRSWSDSLLVMTLGTIGVLVMAVVGISVAMLRRANSGNP